MNHSKFLMFIVFVLVTVFVDITVSSAQSVVRPTPFDLNGNGILDKNEADVVVGATFSLPAGEYQFNNLTVTNNSTLIANGDPTSLNAFKGVKISATNLTINPGSSISADNKGYIAGPGAPPINYAGASYGGVGALNTATSTYGSATAPTDLGSGANAHDSLGGGAIRIVVSGTLTNNGVVSADGGQSSSGGSIYVTTNDLAGTGIFRANGGWTYGVGYYQYPGSGGRIAIYYQRSSFNGSAFSSGGGCAECTGGVGGSGTVVFFDTITNNLIINSSWRFQKNDGPFNFNHIIITDGAQVTAEDGVSIFANSLLVAKGSSLAFLNSQLLSVPAITIDGRSTLMLSGSEALVVDTLMVTGTSTVTVVQGATLSITTKNLTITPGSSISADQKGYGHGTGPGAPEGFIYYAGASYGGVGSLNTATSTYGSVARPTDFGSGGNGYNPYGGGAIRLIVTDTFVNNGTISANGSNTSSGGSIYVTTGTMAGVGDFYANGGSWYCPSICFRAAGGGRIAIYYQTNSFTGQAVARGGGCAGCYGGLGESGTVVLEQSNFGCTINCNSSILFLPGLEASRLYKPDYSGGTDDLWEPYGDADVKNLFMESDGTAKRSNVYTRDIIYEAYGVSSIYRSFATQMDDLKTSGTIKDWQAIPYDWRLSLDDILNNGTKYPDGRLYYAGDLAATSTPYIIQELKRLAKDSRTGKVTIVAHSNGGLVTKALTSKLGVEASQLIDKIILVAVPQTGTPQAVGALLHGFKSGIPEFFPHLLSEETARVFAENMPGAYNLLPSEQYFKDVEEPVVTFDNSPLLATASAKYHGGIINNQTELHDFLLGKEVRTKPVQNDLDTPNVLNDILLGSSETEKRNLDATSTIPQSIKLYQIAGWGVDTLSSIEYYQGSKTYCPGDIYTCTDVPAYAYSPKLTEDGDGTVVIPSALAISTSTANVGRYWVDLGSYNNYLEGRLHRDHKDLLEVPELRSFIQNIITGKTDPLPKYIYASVPLPLDIRKKLRFFLHSPLTLNLYDQAGSHTGIATSTGMVERRISGTDYREFGEVKYVSTTAPTTHLVMNGLATGIFTLDIEEVLEGKVSTTTRFMNIPVSTSTVVTMDISSPDLANISNLKIDSNGDGTPDFQLKPGGIITDTTPPHTTASTTGTHGTNGWFTSDAMVALTAKDNEGGVGIKSTEYSLNNGTTWHTYATTTPLVFSAEGIHSLLYWSTDFFNNVEPIASTTIKIDKTAPEATITFDPATQKLSIMGTDNLGTTTVSTTATSSIITDSAGHTLQIFFSKLKQEGKEIKTQVQELRYDGVSISTLPHTTLNYEWSLNKKNGTIKELEEKVTIGQLEVEAHYDAKKNVTIIEKNTEKEDNEKNDDEKRIRETLQGLIIVGLKTEKGFIRVSY